MPGKKQGLGPSVSRPLEERPWRLLYGALLVLLDTTAASLAVFAVFPVATSGTHVGAAYFALVCSWPIFVALAGGYRARFAGVGLEESLRVLWAALGLLALFTAVAYFGQINVPRKVPIVVVGVALVGGLLTRTLSRRALYNLRSRARCIVRVLVVGDEAGIASFEEQASRDPQAGLRVVAVCTPPTSARPARIPALPIHTSWADLVSTVEAARVELVAFTSCPELDDATVRRLRWQLEGLPVAVAIVPEIREVAAHRMHIRHVSGLAMITVDQPPSRGLRRAVKHATDRIVALVLFVLLLPLMLAVACAISLTSDGPVLFRQTRVKRDGVLFECLKFRSMIVDADSQFAQVCGQNERPDGPHFKILQDPRVTRVGRFLRRYSLDEIPQLVNVITGSMSLVGPRPPLPREVANYTEDTRRRLLVKPGLTGLWQVSGRASLTWTESLRMELRYVENWSLRLDLLIVWKTASAVLRGTGAF